MLVTITILPQNAGTEAVIERDLLAARELRLNGTSGLGGPRIRTAHASYLKVVL